MCMCVCVNFIRLFIGNFQVPILKKWIENDPTEDDPVNDSSEVLPRESAESSQLSTMRRRAN